MRALARFGAIGAAGAMLYTAGTINSIVLRRPSAPLAFISVALIGVALAVLVVACRGRGRGEAAVRAGSRRRRLMRLCWLGVSAFALVGLAWAFGAPPPGLGEATRFHNDAIALDECAARLLLAGRDPYTDLDLFDCYRELGIGPDRTTPLRTGELASARSYPSDAELERVWRLREAAGAAPEFVGRVSYPALSFVLVAPSVALGADPNVVSLLWLLAAVALIVWRAPAGLRSFVLTALLGAACLTAFTVGGSGDPRYALPVVAAWLWRERRCSAVALGIACATKQLAWAFLPYYALAALPLGAREAGVRGAIVAGVFALANAPFVLHDAGAWLAGVSTPFLAPMFPTGAGLVLISLQGPAELPTAALWALTAAAEIACLVWAWRARRSDPELGAVLALVPLYVAPRSLFSYFFLIPLFAAAAVARMPLGSPSPAALRRSGAVTVFATPR